MSNSYKIQLGIDFNDSELKNIKKQLTNLTDNTHRIRIDIDNSRLLKQIDHAKKELKDLNNTKSNQPSLTINTQSLEQSLSRVADVIDEVKKSLGTLDDGAGMKSLVASVNQIATALDKATNESEGLVASLNALSKKDFSVNLGVNMGKSNSVERQSAYGNKVRNETLPQLKKQAEALEDYVRQHYKASDNINGVFRLLKGSTDDFYAEARKKAEVLDLKNIIGDNKASLSAQINAYKEYIKIITEAANLKDDINLNNITSQFSKSADELVKDAQDVQTGVNEASDSFEKLKGIFGASIDADALSTQLTPIASGLTDIKTAIENLSKVDSVNNLTQTFDRLSDVLNGLSSNLAQIQKYFENIANASSGVGNNIAKATEQANKQTKKLISDSAKESIKNVSSKEIGRYFRLDKSDSDSFRDEMNSLVKQWTNGKGNLVDLKIDTRTSYDKDAQANIERLHQAQVTYNNALGETITKTIAWRKIGSDVGSDGKESPVYGFAEVAGRYSKTIGETTVQTNNFVKQQKQAVSNLTNQINQMNRAAKDQNAARPIKESSHLDALSSKYNEIVSAIHRMSNASSDSFIDEQNNVKKLISEYKSLVSEYKNAENVSTKMKGTDFASGLDIAKNDLEKFKAEAKDFPQITKTIENLDNAIKGVGDSSSLNSFNDQLRVARSELAKIKSETTAANRAEKVGINVSGLESKIADLQRISPEIDKFETEIDGAKVTVQSLLNDLKKVNTQSDFSVVNAKWRAFTDAAKSAGIAVTETVTKTKSELANDIKLDIELGEYQDDMSQMYDKFGKLTQASKELCDSVEITETAYRQLMDAANPDNGPVDDEKLIQAQKEYAAAIEKTINLIRIQTREEKAAAAAQKLAQDKESLKLDTTNWLNENTRAAKEYGAELKRLISLLDAVDDPVAFKNIARDIKNVQKAAQVAGKTGLTVFDKLKSKVKEYATYLSAAEVFMYAQQAFSSMFEQVKEIDSAMTELKKVTNETDEAYSQFLTNAASRAKEIGTTISGLVESTADFARLGYEFADAQGLAEVANIYAVVGDDIESVEDATQSLISTLTAFKNEANGLSDSEFALSIVDKMNEVSNNFAISSGGIGDALQRSASSMMAANNSLDETIALITAANTVVQDPASIGQAFKTISMRIRGAKTELEEAGLETDGMVESTAKLRSEIMALTGVDIMDGANQFKSTYAIMDELADKWQDLTDIQQATVTELIAGKRQGNIVSSLMENFDIAEQALETSLNSAGSAMREHEKWQQSLEAQILKLQAAWQGLSQAFLSSDFLKVALDGVIALVDGITKLIEALGAGGTIGLGAGIWATISHLSSVTKDAGGLKSLKDISNILPALGKAFPNASKAIGGFFAALKGGKGIVTALKAGLSGLWGVISAHPIMAVVAAVGIGIAAFNKYTESAKELADRIEEVTTKYKEQRDSLNKLKSNYDASNEDSMISKYGRLSKGIDVLGENVSLTADEYAEYQSIVNTIAEQIPSLVTGYNSQGDAILDCAGDVAKLTEEYKNLIKAQNSEVLETGADIIKGFQNDLRKTSMYQNNSDNPDSYNADHLKQLKEIMNLSDDELVEYINSLSSMEVERLSGLLEEYGIERDVMFGNGLSDFTSESWDDHIIRAVNEQRAKVKGVLDDSADDLNAYAEDLGTVTEAYFSTAFLGGDNSLNIGDYSHLSERMQNIINQITSSFGSDFYSQFLNDENPYESLTNYLNTLLDTFNNLGSEKTAKLEATFDLKTQFNSGDIDYGEYINSLKDASHLIDGLDVDDDIKTQIKLALNTEEAIKEYDALVNRLTSKEIGLNKDAAKEFLDSLSAEEFAIATKIIPELNVNASIEEIQSMIDRELALNGITVDLNVEVEKANIEALTTAITESFSGSGLSSESLIAIESIFSDLNDYDPSKLFERTANGIRLNSDEFRKLNSEYKKTNLDKVNDNLNSLGDIYNQTKEELYKLTYGTEEYNRKSAELSTIEERIKATEQLAYQYKGLASAYQSWQMAESSGSQRDMYESMIDGFENVDDEIKRGWLDDGTIEFLRLIKGDTISATATTKELTDAYKSLDDTIKDTSYSIRDFFTVDEDGNSTNTGVYNFLDAIGQLEEEKFGGKDVVKRDKKGNVIGFDFQIVGGDKAIADALGISEELVQIMVRAADDAGFVVSMDGTYQQLDILKEKAQEAADALKNTFNKTEFDFDLNTGDKNSVLEQYNEALNIWEEFKANKNSDGTINMNVEGAQEAYALVSTLQSMVDKLGEPAYMKLDATQVEKDMKTPLSKLQEYERLVQQENQLKLKGTDTTELDNAQEEILNYFENLEPEVKASLGIKDLSKEELQQKLEAGEIEIPATIDLQVEMNNTMRDMVNVALYNAGLIDGEELEKRVDISLYANEVDASNVVNDIESVLEESDLSEDKNITINAFAEVFGVDNVESLAEKLDSLEDEQIQVIAEVLGKIDVEQLKDAINSLDDKTVEAIAKALGEGDVDNLKDAINGLDDKTVKAIAEAFGYDGVEELNKAIENLDPKTVKAIAEVLGITDVDSLKGAIDRLSSKNVEAVANVSGKKEVDNLKSSIDGLKGKTVTIWAQVKKIASNLWGHITGGGNDGGSGVNGTANVNGTTGRAFKQGSWGTKNSGTALVGELGAETLVRDGRYYTIGNDGAEFIKYKKGDIIFNHKQTEELFKNGKVTSGGGRAKALVGGTAFVNGSTGSSGVGKVALETTTKTETTKTKDSTKTTTTTSTTTKSGKGSSGSGGVGKAKGESVNSSSGSKSSKKEDEFEETFDWVEIAISRIERAVDQLDQKANNVYKSWSERNSALVAEIGKVGEEIELQQTAYDKYIQEANNVGLSSYWQAKIKYGEIDVSTIEDEALAEKIKKYQEWYEKALDCQDAIEELKETEAELYKQRFDNIKTQYEGALSVIEHEKNMLEEYINQSEAQAWLVSSKYYDALAKNERDNIAKLEKEKAALLSQLEANMTADGTPIAKGSEAWYEMVNAIDEVTLAIEKSNTAILEYQQTIQQLDWEIFDLLQEKISAVSEESEFLIELMSNKKLYDDNGQLTDEGMATMGLHGVNYNTLMHQADLAAAEAERIKEQMVDDPFDTELEARYREMISLQQEYILAAEESKNAIRDLVEDGIELELDALQERINKYNEALDSQKDLYDYQRKVKEQTEEIASLQKQMAAYANDNSEEARAKIQELKVSLEDAEADLEEMQYERYISDQEKLLDDLYLEYETILNERLDNIDALVSDMIDEINANSSSISSTITESAEAVGYTISGSMETIWNGANDVITMYGSQFASAQTNTNTALNLINTNLQAIISALNSRAETKVDTAKTSSAANSTQANATPPVTKPATPTTPATQPTSSGGDGVAKVGDKVKFVSGKYYYDSYGTNPLGSKYQGQYVYITKINSKGTHPYHISTSPTLGKGDLGWLKLNQLSGYASGKKNFLNDEVAWTQENGLEEYIVRPSDGAILTPIARKGSVLNAQASNNLWNMTNSPAEFIRDNLNLGAANIPNNSNSQNTYTQHLDKVVFNLPNVKNYEELLSEMQKDKNFERLILSMSIDRLAGKSSLAKGKAIR